MTPEIKHDLKLCELYRVWSRASDRLSRAANYALHAGDRGVIAEYRKAAAAVVEAQGPVAEAHLAVLIHEKAYAGWRRFYLVTSSSGHVHSSERCCTCHKGRQRTTFALVPYLSGKSEAEAVADLGPALCSVCFPSAPAEHREQTSVPANQASILAEQGVEAFQAAREAAKSRAAAKCHGSGLAPAELKKHGGAKCPCCDGVFRVVAGKVANHKATTYVVERLSDGKCLGLDGVWGPKTKAVSHPRRDQAKAVADSFQNCVVRAK